MFALTVAALTAGCHWLPVRRVDPTLFPRQGEANDSKTSLDDQATLPPLPLKPLTDQEILATLPPTPMLDAALVRAEAEQRAVLDEVLAPAKAEEHVPAPAPDPAQPEPKVEPKEPELPAPAPPSPAETWREGLAQLRSVAREHVEGGEATSPVWEVRARLLAWMADDEAPGADVSLWQAVLSVLATPDPPESAEIRAAALALEGEAPLEITDLRFCRKVQGFGNFEPLDASSCKAGKPLILYCEMAGLQYEPDGEQFRSRLTARVEVVAEGADPVWTHDLGSAEDTCHRRRRDYYVNWLLTWPPHLKPGSYQLCLIQKDELGGRETSRAIPFTIVP